MKTASVFSFRETNSESEEFFSLFRPHPAVVVADAAVATAVAPAAHPPPQLSFEQKDI